jgi:hypothetical protein
MFNTEKSRLTAISNTIIPVIGYVIEKRSPQKIYEQIPNFFKTWQKQKKK